MNPSLDWFVIETGALDVLAAVVWISEITNVITVDTTFGVNLDNITIVMANRLVIFQNFSTVEQRIYDLLHCFSLGKVFLVFRPFDGCRNGYDNGSSCLVHRSKGAAS